MSSLQWALLIFAVIAVVAVYVLSRRDRRAMRRDDDEADPAPRSPQLDIFDSRNAEGYDEFGVGKARRVAPMFDSGEAPAPAPVAPGPRRAPTLESVRAHDPRTGPLAAANESRQEAQRIVTLLIAQPTGQPIPGPDVHRALAGQGLQFGARQIYHRLRGDEAVFSVASLLKPGHLDPAIADDFQTPGLTLFMVLPGPVRAVDAVRDMIATGERLARELDAEVFDAKKQPFTPTSARALEQDIEAWARLHHA